MNQNNFTSYKNLLAAYENSNKIESYETDKNFYNILKEKVSNNVDLKLVNTNYIESKILNNIDFSNHKFPYMSHDGLQTYRVYLI